MKRNLLIHSMSLFSPITLPLLELINARVIAEIGAEHGGNSRLLYDWLKPRGGKLLSIDCSPSDEFYQWHAQVSEVVTHINKPSLDVLREVESVDAWFVDGDHNYYTVYHELLAIRQKARQQNKPLLIFMHDVSWPCARRDMYYSPDRIPESDRHPFTWDQGVTLDNQGVINGGFRSNGVFAIAIHEGGPRNGVLTAIEDFIAEFNNEFCFSLVPAVFGLGVLYDAAHPHAKEMQRHLMPYHNNSLLSALEINRLDNYLKVLEFQDMHHASAQAAPEQQSADQDRWREAVLYLLGVLSDDVDDPNLWDNIKSQLPEEMSELDGMLSYLDTLLYVPNNKEAVKLICLLQAMCLSKKGDLSLSNAILEKLSTMFPKCSLIFGAYRYNALLLERV